MQCSSYIRVGKYFSTSLPTPISWQQCLETFDAKVSWAQQGKQQPVPSQVLMFNTDMGCDWQSKYLVSVAFLIEQENWKNVGGLIWKKSAKQ